MRLPWTVKFVRPQVPRQDLLRRGIPDIVEITLPLYSPDDDPRVLFEQEPNQGLLPPAGVITVRLSETEMEFVAEAYLQSRQERRIEGLL